MDYGITKGLITKILETRDFATVKENQIKLEFFKGEDKSAFKYILDQVQATGATPSIRAFKNRFPNYELDCYQDGTVGNEEVLLHWITEMRNKVKFDAIADMMEKTSKLLDNQDNTEEAYDLIKKQIAEIESEIVLTTAVSILNVENRKEAYLRKKNNHGMIGIPTGFEKFDYLTKGLAESTLTTVIAQTGVGKSWFQVLIGAHCMLEGFKVLQLITEMPEETMRDRYEAILCAKAYGNFNYSNFKSGALSPQQEKNYFDLIDKDIPSYDENSLILDIATSPIGVSALVDKYTPDIVFIDSAYLMEDDQKARDDWLRVAHITRDLKKIAKRCKIPILINSQANNSTSRKTGPELGSISYSQSIGMDSDIVIAMYRDQAMISDNEMGIKILKQREGILGKIILNWDFTKMDFSDIYSEEENQDNPNTIKIEDD